MSKCGWSWGMGDKAGGEGKGKGTVVDPVVGAQRSALPPNGCSCVNWGKRQDGGGGGAAKMDQSAVWLPSLCCSVLAGGESLNPTAHTQRYRGCNMHISC